MVNFIQWITARLIFIDTFMKQWARAIDVSYYKSILVTQEQEQAQEQEQPTDHHKNNINPLLYADYSYQM